MKSKKRRVHKVRAPIPRPGHSWSKKDYNRKREKSVKEEK